MTDNEKKLLQAKHRLEEAQMRDRQKERKARTRRLIQEGAILEKVYPAATDMDLTKLEDFLYWALRRSIMGALRATGALLFFPKGALIHHPEGAVVLAVGKPCALRGGLRLLRKPPDNATAPASAVVIVCAIGQIPSLQLTLFFQPPAQTCHRQLCRRDGRAGGPPIFSFAKEKQKKGIEVNETWQFITWKRRWSAGAQDALLWPPPLI